MLNFIYYPVSAIMWFWHKAFGYLFGESSGIAWALAVVFLVFTLRALLYKPFVHQVRSMRKMQEFAPEMQKLRANCPVIRHGGSQDGQVGIGPVWSFYPWACSLSRWVNVHDWKGVATGHSEAHRTWG